MNAVIVFSLLLGALNALAGTREFLPRERLARSNPELVACIESLCGSASENMSVKRAEEWESDLTPREIWEREFQEPFEKILKDRASLDNILRTRLALMKEEGLQIPHGHPLTAWLNYQLLQKKVFGKPKLKTPERIAQLISERLKNITPEEAEPKNVSAKILILRQRLGSSLVDLILPEYEKYSDAFMQRVYMLDAVTKDSELSNLLSGLALDLNSLFPASHFVQKESAALQHSIQLTQKTNFSIFERSLTLSASPLRIRRFQMLASDVMSAAKEVAVDFADPKATLALVAELNAVNISLPENIDSRLERLRLMIEVDTLAQRQRKRLMEQAADKDMDIYALSWLLNEDSRYSAFETACRTLPKNVLSDASGPRLARMSWFSAAYPQIGAGILAHEIGHIVSHFIRGWNFQNRDARISTAFKDSLECISNRNPFTEGPASFINSKGNTQWSEEDWADHFASLVLKKMEANGVSWWKRTSTPFCAMIPREKGQYNSPSLAPFPEDAHSQPVLRLILSAHDRGMMTPQCAAVIENSGLKDKKLRCH